MALSGTFYSNVNSYWRIQGEWSATQNLSANSSSVTLKTYWIATSSNGAVYSSATKSGSSTIEGTTDSFTGSAALSGNQKKLINTQTKTINHNADGTFPDLDLAVSFGIEVTLNGTYYGTVSSSASYALNTIPRESTLSSTPSWTGGNNFTVSVNRASSSFRHEAELFVLDSSGTYGTSIKTISLSSSQTSVSSSFTEAENTALFNKLGGATSRGTRLRLYTYDGNTLIGSSTYKDGTITAPASSYPASGYDAYQYTDELIDFPVKRANGAFTHTVRIKLGSYTKTITGVTTSVSWQPSTAEQSSLNSQMPNDSIMNGTIEIDTYYNGVQVRGTNTSLLQFHVRDADPVFTGSITYQDTRSTTTAITENDQYIIQGQSWLAVTLSASSVTAQKGATMSGFVFTVAGESQTTSYTTSAITRYFSTIDAATNQTIIVEAVDSRGNKSQVSKIVTVVPYSVPTLASAAVRINGFEAETLIQMISEIKPLLLPAGSKNFITNARYRTREKNGTWGSYVSFAGITQDFEYTSEVTEIIFDITKAYEVEFSVSDRLGTTNAIRTVGVGRPIFFINSALGSLGMNDFPKDPNTFLLNGQLTFAGNLYASTGEGGGAIFLNNGDITGANGIWFGDTANNAGEGLLFIKSGAANNSTASADYDNFYIRDQHLYLNSRDFMQVVDGGSAGSLVRIGAGG
ncbi:MAG: DUF859 domain-containing protein, partial [Actinobacteria bacterium]|nr:DUF859 domain-containing protein [Actinomycetota bacterium]